MKFSIIIEARVGSTRLPNKILYKIKRNNFLEFLIKRLKSSKKMHQIIVATTNNPNDEKIVKIAKKNKVKSYRGPEHNVQKRVIDAGKKFGCESIIRITSDCPLSDPVLIDQAAEIFELNKCDYLSNIHKVRTYPDGMDIEIFSLRSLIKSAKLIKVYQKKQWTTCGLRENPKKFKHLVLVAPKDLKWPELHLTLDEYDDYKFLKKIILHFKEKYFFSCLDIVNLLKKKKQWLKINNRVKRNY